MVTLRVHVLLVPGTWARDALSLGRRKTEELVRAADSGGDLDVRKSGGRPVWPLLWYSTRTPADEVAR